MNKIKSILIQNFMSIEFAEIPFPESDVLSIVGMNDSGKSAITRALGVMLYNYKPTKQGAFIQDGKDFFKIQLSFSDGVVYTRIKYSNGNSYFELSDANTTYYTNKLEDGSFTSVANIPDIIANYLGVAVEEETGEYLNLRRNKDKLFLVDTSGGVNYKIINYLLKSDDLSKASIALNKDKNALNTKCKNSKVAIETLEKQLDGAKVVTEDYINNFEGLCNSLNNLSKAKDALDTLSTDWASLNNLPKCQKVPNKVSDSLLNQLNLLNNIAKEYKDSTNFKPIKVPSKVDVAKISQLDSLENLLSAALEFSKIQEALKKNTKNLKDNQKKRDKFADENHLQTCPNCGNIFIGEECC